MTNVAKVFLLNVLVLATISAQEKPKEAQPEGGGSGRPVAPTRIVLEEKQASAVNTSMEVRLENGARVRLRMGAQAILTQYEMSDARGETLDAVKISQGEVEVDCPPGKTVNVWVPDGDITINGGEHAFAVLKDGWRQTCIDPVAFVEEGMTGAKWQMCGQQKTRVERVERCILITHEKNSEERIYVWIPAGWVVHTWKGEDLKKDDKRMFSGRGIDELPEGKPLKLPMIVRLDPADAVLIVPAQLPAARQAERRIELPERVVISPLGPVSPL